MKTALRTLKSKLAIPLILAAVGLFTIAGAQAQPGTSLGVVVLPGNGSCSVAGSFDGTYYITVNTSSCSGTVIGIYKPPPTGAGPATLISTKAVVDGANNPVTISAVDWDAGRNLLWGVFGSGSGRAWLIDLGDKTMSGTATATLAFNYSIPGFDLVDGLAYDFVAGDVLHISPDVSAGWWSFSATGTPMGNVVVKNAAGQADGAVSGLAIGANNTMYVSRDGTGEIRRVNKTNGTFVSSFATTNFRVEDLTCDATTYAPLEAVLAKDAFGSSYEAFEVEPGTCPQVDVGPGPPFMLDLQPPADENDVGTQHCLTATVTDEDGEPVPDITVVFEVEGASEADQNPPDEDGTAVTNDEGVATFCYTGPDFPGADTIHAFADTDEDGMEDLPPPAGEEPFDDATKAWVLPTPTVGCEVTISNGGWIIVENGDKANLGGHAQVFSETNVDGNQEYQDKGPLTPINYHSNEVLTVVCSADRTQATMYATGTVDGAGMHLARIDVHDNGEPSSGPPPDTYDILIDNGYDSSEDRPLQGGNIQIQVHED